MRGCAPCCDGRQAAAVLRDIADVDSEEGLAAIMHAGAVPGLVRLLRGGPGGPGGQALGPTMAAAALANLAQCEEVRGAITAADGIPLLVELLTYPMAESQVGRHLPLASMPFAPPFSPRMPTALDVYFILFAFSSTYSLATLHA